MRILFSFMCVLALGLMGCSEGGGSGGSAGTGGSGGDGGSGGTGGMGGEGGTGGTGGDGVACTDKVCPCTEGGIRAAIAEGGGPFTFDCEGPTTVMTKDTIVIDNDVVLDGGGALIIDGADSHSVLLVPDDVTVELQALTVTGGGEATTFATGILNDGVLRLSRVSVQGNSCTGGPCIGAIISIGGTALLTISDSAITDNTGIALVAADATLTNVTIAGNTDSPLEGTIWSWGSVTLVNCTVSDVEAFVGGRESVPPFLRGTLIEGDCGRTAVSNGHNIESPGDTCGFDQATDQVNVTAEQLNLGPLQDNGGPTMTHALGAGSVAIDQIPEVDCLDADAQPLTTDQRGEPRPETGGTMCDVGAFEVQP